MAARGPRPVPTEVLRARGSPRANLNRGEPQPKKGEPPKPEWLDDVASLAWDKVMPQLLEMRVVSHADENAIARYVSLWSQWRAALEFIKRHGTTYPIKDGNGKLKALGQFPEVGQVHKLSLALSRLEAEFGLTPSARTRINVPIAPRELTESEKKYFPNG